MTKKFFFNLILFSVSAFSLSFAQVISLHRSITWKEPLETSITETEKIKSLFFEGATYDEKNNPVYFETISLEGNPGSIRVVIENAQYESLKETTILNANSKIKSEINLSYKIGYRKKKPIACITITPFRKLVSGTIEKLVSFDLKITPSTTRSSEAKTATRVYTNNSVLASGNWYKIGTTKDGVHKITYQFLKDIGMDIDHIDPRTIRLFGNGGGQLPFLNSTFRYDDLQENAIYISGESDSKFDANDFILFYGQDQVIWNQDTTGAFTHSVNDYSDTTFYFITYGGSLGKRILLRPSSSQSPNQTITSYDENVYHEDDASNIYKSGRQWFGESFDNLNPKVTWTVSEPNILTTEPVKINASAISRSVGATATLTLALNGSPIGSPVVVSATSSGVAYNYANTGYLSGIGHSSSSSLNVSLSFSSSDQSSLGMLDYFELSCRNALNFPGGNSQFLFRDSRSVGSGNIGEFILSNALSSVKIWDVTDPLNVVEQQTIFNNGQLSFIYPSDNLHEYLVFNGSNFPSPVSFGNVPNQNLHSLQQAQMIIVTNPLFLNQANALAEFHRAHDQLTVNVATTDQVFNEFSSGAQDVSAIRDFMKMFYDRATLTDLPKYLLLFGDASYDNKHRLSGNTNFVTSYQSVASLNLTTSYISDDFFGLLDDNEGIWSPDNSNELLDISVGRIPAKSVAEAEAVLNKIITYESADAFGENTVFGDWRNNITFVGDDQDQNTHFNQSESLATTVKNNYPVYNEDKIYLDAYKQETTPGGQRYPDAEAAIVQKVERGTLLMTYIGHGGEVGWAHESVLTDGDINGWTNSKHLAAFLTATCEFTRVDDPSRTSAGELVLLNPKGGGICLFSTSRLAYSGSNFSLAQKFYTHVLQSVNGVMPTCGEVFEQTKIDYTDRYTRNFLLIGDPALRLAYPKFDVVTNSINTHPVSSTSDTLRALSKVTITGEIRDKSGNKLTSFNGIVYPTVFDKWVTYMTQGNDQYWTGDGGNDWPAPFLLQKNVLYKGKAKVTNGDFSFTFIVPKDIAYQYGFGKLSYYADNGQIDANGYYSNVVIGGINDSAAADNTGPDIKLYMNDDKFVFGGLTDANPYLYAIVHDANGINTVGNGIGHDVTSELDNDNSKMTVLNDYYEADIDSYQSGKVKYQLHDLAEGPHSLNFKVWDVYNNSSDARTEFVVASSAALALNHVLNYPNPFTTHTTFMFEHNHPFSRLNVQIQIFTVSGRLIKTIQQDIDTEGYRSDDIEWNGLDDFGDKIGRGVYLYKIRVKASDNTYAEKFEKLVILR